MPSTSKSQHNLMAMVANDPAAAKRVGVPQSVGQDYMQADKGKRFKSEGRADSQVANRLKTNQGKQELFSKGGDTMASKMNPGFMAMMAKKKGAQEGSKADMASDKKQMMNMKKGGGVKKMAAGGLSSGHKAADGVASKGKTVAKQVTMKRGGKC